ncbi:MAG TPA: hypothetical protein VGX23_20360 [Actinocrinis sp.]|nr:hypothetical protein [Actinocrinis sp.]
MSRRAGEHTRTAPDVPRPARPGRAEAGRLLAGDPVRDGRNLGLERLLADAAAPDRDQAPAARGLAAVLAAFAEAAPTDEAAAPANVTTTSGNSNTTGSPTPAAKNRTGHRQLPLRAPAWTRRLALRCAVALALVFGAGTAAAADALPAPVQSLVYDVFGDLGVPPPSEPPSPGADPKTQPAAGRPAGTGPAQKMAPDARLSPTAGPPTSDGPSQAPAALPPTALCETAAQSLATPGALTPADLAQLTADAGDAENIPAYCAALLESASPGGYLPTGHASWSAEPTPGSTDFPRRTTKATEPPAPKATPKTMATKKNDDSKTR